MLLETTLTGLIIEETLYFCEVVIVFSNTFSLNELRTLKAEVLFSGKEPRKSTVQLRLLVTHGNAVVMQILSLVSIIM
jgi:hypothetical protein